MYSCHPAITSLFSILWTNFWWPQHFSVKPSLVKTVHCTAVVVPNKLPALNCYHLRQETHRVTWPLLIRICGFLYIWSVWTNRLPCTFVKKWCFKLKDFWGHDVDRLGSCDVVIHVTIGLAEYSFPIGCQFELTVSHSCWDNKHTYRMLLLSLYHNIFIKCEYDIVSSGDE